MAAPDSVYLMIPAMTKARVNESPAHEHYISFFVVSDLTRLGGPCVFFCWLFFWRFLRVLYHLGCWLPWAPGYHVFVVNVAPLWGTRFSVWNIGLLIFGPLKNCASLAVFKYACRVQYVSDNLSTVPFICQQEFVLMFSYCKSHTSTTCWFTTFSSIKRLGD